MNKLLVRLSAFIAVLPSMLLFAGCYGNLPLCSYKNYGVEVGEEYFIPLLDCWYFDGKFNQPYCKDENGVVYYTDASQIFLKRRKDPVFGMVYQTYIREDAALPDIHDSESIIQVSMANKPMLTLNEEEKADYLQLLDCLSNGEGTVKIDWGLENAVASSFCSFSNFEKLSYIDGCWIIRYEDDLWLSNMSGTAVLIEKDTPLYRFLIDNLMESLFSGL